MSASIERLHWLHTLHRIHGFFSTFLYLSLLFTSPPSYSILFQYLATGEKPLCILCRVCTEGAEVPHD